MQTPNVNTNSKQNKSSATSFGTEERQSETSKPFQSTEEKTNSGLKSVQASSSSARQSKETSATSSATTQDRANTETNLKADESSAATSKGKGSEEAASPLQLIDQAKDAFVEQIDDVANRVMALTPKSGVLNKVGKFVSDRLVTTSTYIGEKKSSEIGAEAWTLLRKNAVPVTLAAVGVGVGLFMSRKMQNDSSEEKKQSSSETAKSETSGNASKESSKGSQSAQAIH